MHLSRRLCDQQLALLGSEFDETEVIACGTDEAVDDEIILRSQFDRAVSTDRAQLARRFDQQVNVPGDRILTRRQYDLIVSG